MNHAENETSPAAMLETMMLVRAFEEQNAALAAGGKMGGTCTSVGQEAAGVGVVKALAPHDRILTNHRSVAHLLARGADPARLLAEIMGKQTGYCKGKSGSLHVSVKDLGVVLTSTIVGGELSLAPGVALSLEMKQRDGIVACFFGDGAAGEGVFHESVNLAAIWNLPILYVCENNQWQAFVHRRETMIGERIADRAAAYGIEGITVDGNDVDAVYEAARNAVAKIRRQRKPILLETYTYRTRGHYEPDDQGYVGAAELAHWKARDPIELLKSRMLEQRLTTHAELERIESRVNARIADALAFAQSSPYPVPSELTTDVYA